MISIKEKQKKAFAHLKSQFGYKNVMQAPKLVKVIVTTGVGKVADKKKKELISDRLAKITGQKVAPRQAKKSIASFKVRAGDQIGYQVTLREARMFDFLDKLVDIALPRTKDFRGLTAHAIDNMGNFTIGMKENTVFPETSDEELKDVFGLAVTIVTNVKDKIAAKAFLEYLGFPFKKGEEAKRKRAKKEKK